jgi:hypothetical protein
VVWDIQNYQKCLPESQSLLGCFEIGAIKALGLGTKTQSPSEYVGVKGILHATLLLMIIQDYRKLPEQCLADYTVGFQEEWIPGTSYVICLGYFFIRNKCNIVLNVSIPDQPEKYCRLDDASLVVISISSGLTFL